MTAPSATVSPPPAGRAPGLLAPLAHRPFRTFWVAGLSDNLGRWIDTIVLGWVALSLTNSVWLVAVAGFMRLLPILLLSAVIGSAADRYGRRTMLTAAMALNASVCAAMAGLFFAGALSYPLLAIGAFGLGTGLAVEMTVRRALLADLSDPAALLPAVSLEMLTLNMTRVLGPIIAGSLLAGLGGGVGYAASAVLYAVSALLLARLPQPDGRAAPEGSPPPPSVPMLEALRRLLREEAIVGVLAVTVVMNLAVFQYQQILSVFARDILHTDAFGFGLLSAADALGSTIGIVLLAQRPKAPQAVVFVGSCVGMCLLLTAFTFVTVFPLALVTLLCFGMVHAGFSTMQSSVILRAAAAEVRGRAGGWLSMAIGTGPLGLLVMGWLSAALGPGTAVAAGALTGLALVGGLTLRLPRFRSYRW